MRTERFDPENDTVAVRACHDIHVAAYRADGVRRAPMSPRVFSTWMRYGWAESPVESWLARDDEGEVLGWYLLCLPDRENPHVGHGIMLDPEGFDESGDWTYSGYSMLGSRVTIPWETCDEPAQRLSGVVQLDFAADEPMPRRPVWIRVPRLAGGFSVLWAAGPELSLVWKLMWLVEDSKDGGASRGKDLYDAVVLAELTSLQTAIRAGGPGQAGLRRRDVDGLQVDWEAFVAEYPQVEGSVGEWKQRLVHALGLM